MIKAQKFLFWEMALVSFRDSSLYKNDLDAIKHGWLTSNAIDFFFCLLGEKHEERMKQCVLVSPATVFLVLMSSSVEDASEMVESLGFAVAKFVLFPLNDQSTMTSSNGTHWSLLVFDRGANAFIHYDSMRGNNKKVAIEAFGWKSACLSVCSNLC